MVDGGVGAVVCVVVHGDGNVDGDSNGHGGDSRVTVVEVFALLVFCSLSVCLLACLID